MTDQDTYRPGAEMPAAAPAAPLPGEPYYENPPTAARRGRNTGLGIALVVIGLLLLAFQLLGRSLSFGGNYTLVDQQLPGNRLELTVGASDVEVHRWDGRAIKIEAIQRGGSRGDYQVQVDQSGDTVRITESNGSWFCLFCSRSVAYRIDVPQSAQAAIKTTSGTIDVQGLGGPVTLATNSGDVHAEDLQGGLSVSTTSGEVNVSNIAGQLTVGTISGDVRLNNGAVAGATVNTTSGEIDLDGVGGALQLGTVSGDITVHDARESQLDIASTSGEIKYTGALLGTGDSKVTTISGDVQLALPEQSRFALDASTVSGEVTSEFDVAGAQDGQRNLSGAIGGGGPALTVETTSGNISLEQR